MLLYGGVLLLAFFAYRLKKLSFSGMIASIGVGSAISYGLGLSGLLILAVFFITSTMWSSLWKQKKENPVQEKGDRRDAWQVLANGGIASVIALFYGINPSDVWLFGFAASLAAANADTWASEIGTLSRQRPVHLLTWKRVEPGTSGAVTALGSAAAFAGSFLIAVVAILLWWGSYYNSHILLIAITLVGFIGNFVDTIVGASLQVEYRCSTCGVRTEVNSHCGEETEYISGVKWLNNDYVNVLCTATGALLGMLVALLLL